MVRGINLKVPFENNQTAGGVFKQNRLTSQSVADDMLTLLTTKRGSRVMRSKIYSPIYDYLHENIDDLAVSNLKKDIKQKINEFMFEVDVLEIRITPSFDENMMKINILFTTKSLFNAPQSVTVNVPVPPGSLTFFSPNPTDNLETI